MKSTKLAVALALALTSAAHAGDSVSLTTSSERNVHDINKRTNSLYTLNYIHSFESGFGIGAQYNFSQTPKTNTVKSLAEVNGYYTYKINNELSVRAGLGLGERFQSYTKNTSSSGNFPFYAVYGSVDYKLNDRITWTAISYRYRNSFDNVYAFETHQYSTGVSYAVTNNISVAARIYQKTDENFKPTANGVSVGLTSKF